MLSKKNRERKKGNVIPRSETMQTLHVRKGGGRKGNDGDGGATRKDSQTSAALAEPGKKDYYVSYERTWPGDPQRSHKGDVLFKVKGGEET